MIFVGYGKYFRDGGDTCMTDEYGKFKYHYCKEAGGGADVCKETPPQQVTKPNHLPRAKPNHLPRAKSNHLPRAKSNHLPHAKPNHLPRAKPNHLTRAKPNHLPCPKPNHLPRA